MVSPFATSSYAKILGISWDSQSDNFLFDFTDLIEYAQQLPPNKRSLLKFTAKIYDPLGLLSPFVICLKVLFQTPCTNQQRWDEPMGRSLKFGIMQLLSFTPLSQ